MLSFLFICFKVHVSEISDKTGTFLLNYSNSFSADPLFIGTRWGIYRTRPESDGRMY